MKIILVVPPSRTDYYSYLARATDVEWVLLWYEKPAQMNLNPADLPIQFKEIIFWQDFLTPASLLRKINPDRILFFEIIDLRQIALIVTAGARGIPTYYSDHGAAADKDATLKFLQTRTFKENTLPYLLKRLRNNLFDAVKSKLFYFSAIKGFKSIRSYGTYFLLPFKMLLKSSHEVLLKNKFRERVPRIPIVFNEPNFDDFQTYTGVQKQDVFISGVPFFDKYYDGDHLGNDYVVYIDHPYYEDRIGGWTKEHHQHVAQRLFQFFEERKIRLYVKLHPRSNRKLWEEYEFNSEYVELLQEGDFTDLYLNAKLILGFSSSLMNGFLCAKKNVVLLGWNPVPHIEGADFSLTGLCHASLRVEDLETQFDNWMTHNLAIDNKDRYDEFLKKYNYPFDGKATERIIRVLQDPGFR